jgi:hypothetical protein
MKWTLPGVVTSTGAPALAPALVPVPARPGRPTRVALGALGLVLLFGLGYQISARRRRTATA